MEQATGRISKLGFTGGGGVIGWGRGKSMHDGDEAFFPEAAGVLGRRAGLGVGAGGDGAGGGDERDEGVK